MIISSALLFVQMVLPGHVAVADDKPSTCQKYQHVVQHPAYASGECAPVQDQVNSICADMMVYHAAEPDSCADDMHEVTERDWQDILKRLQELEGWHYCFTHSCNLTFAP